MGLLERRDVNPLIVLDDRVDRELPVVDLADLALDRAELEQLASAESALAHHDHEAAGAIGPDGDRLLEPVLADRIGQLLERGRLERLTRLIGVAVDAGERKVLRHARTSEWRKVCTAPPISR